MTCVWVAWMWCEKYLGTLTNGLCLGDQLVVRDWVTYPWLVFGYPAHGVENNFFFTNDLCLGDQPVVCDRVTCLWSLIR